MLTKRYNSLFNSPLWKVIPEIESLTEPFNFPYSKNHMDSYLNEDGSVTFTMDLPGVKQEDLNIEVVDNVVSIRAERKDRKSSFTFSESFTISEKFDSQTLVAELHDGVLNLSVSPAKVEDKQVRKIPVTVK